MKTIYDIRRLLGMTQAELGQLLDKSKRTIGRWELDEVKLDVEAVKNLAFHQGCPLPGDEGFDFKKIRKRWNTKR